MANKLYNWVPLTKLVLLVSEQQPRKQPFILECLLCSFCIKFLQASLSLGSFDLLLVSSLFGSFSPFVLSCCGFPSQQKMSVLRPLHVKNEGSSKDIEHFFIGKEQMIVFGHLKSCHSLSLDCNFQKHHCRSVWNVAFDLLIAAVTSRYYVMKT